MSAESDLGWIDRCRRVEERWRGRVREVLKLYRDDAREEKDTSVRYNILWANTEAMKPALYSAVPEPVVSRRYKDEDLVGKEVSKVCERALEYFLDCQKFDVQAKKMREDYLLPGRAVMKVHYVPTMAYGEPPRIQLAPVYAEDGTVKAYSDGEEEHLFAEQDDNGFYKEGEAEEEVVDEAVDFERVPWDLVVFDTQRCWDDVTKIAFGAYMDAGTLKKYFGRKAKSVEMNHDSTDVDERQGQGEKKYALVWEIWDKRKREVRCVCKGYDGYLSKEKDPLKIEGFFPTPEPAYAVKTNDSMVPIPLYTLYQDQARELEVTTARLYKIIDAIRVRGFYAGTEEANLKQLFASDDLELIPITNFSQIAGGGGLDKMIAWLPVEQLMKTAMSLNQHRMMLIESIYEITGMADIMRGATDPRETKGAQVLKSQYGSRRLVDHKQELERYFRDLLRIAGEIICEKFSPETLTRITGVQVTPEMKQMMSDDAMRSYHIDIETDSTVAPDEQRDKEQAVEAITALGQFAALVGPLVQAGQMSKEAASGAAQWFVRKFRMGRDLEDFMRQMEQQPPQPPPPDPEQQAKAQAVQQKSQLDQQKAQMDAQLKMQEFQMEMQQMVMEMKMEMAKMQQELAIEKQKAQMDAQIKMVQASANEKRKDSESEAKQEGLRKAVGAANA